MPGPAGGGGGGGFGGGSRGGGGGFGGGFGGGPHRHHHHHGGFFFFPWYRPYYGFGGGFMGLFLLPIILLIFAGVFLISSIVALVSAIANGGVVQYTDRKFEDYAMAQYEAEFGEYTETYEDNLLIIFTTTEDLDGYYTIAFAGDNISDEINLMFGDDAEFGASMNKNVKTDDYKYSLDKNLAMMVNEMRKYAMRYDSFIYPSEAEHAGSYVINRDEDLDFTEETVNKALTTFSEDTGIPIVLIIEDEEDVFGKTFPVGTVISGVLSLGVIVFAVVWIIKASNAKKKAKREAENRRNGTDYNDPRYWN